jgi:hypothetical protein
VYVGTHTSVRGQPDCKIIGCSCAYHKKTRKNIVFRLGVQVDSYVCCTENIKLYFCARHILTNFARFGSRSRLERVFWDIKHRYQINRALSNHNQTVGFRLSYLDKKSKIVNMYFYLVTSILYYSTGHRTKKGIRPVNKFTLVGYCRLQYHETHTYFGLFVKDSLSR